jgi:hypothetical protein
LRGLKPSLFGTRTGSHPLTRMAKKVHSWLRYVLLLMALVIAILLVPALIPRSRAYPAIAMPQQHYHKLDLALENGRFSPLGN